MTADRASIKSRIRLYQQIRLFFQERNLLEVEVPLLHTSSITHLHLEPFSLVGETYYLQTSPELFMKRLLARGMGDIFTITKAFRHNEEGSQHNPEFSLLEWYRVQFDEWQLMDEVEQLLRRLLAIKAKVCFSYRHCFEEYLGIDPHRASSADLTKLAASMTSLKQSDLSGDALLGWLMEAVVQPSLQKEYPDSLVFIHDFPTSQCEMAQTATDRQGQLISRRFEAYYGGLELANGYFELADPNEQRQRMEQGNLKRQQAGLPTVPLDDHFLAGLASMPPCSGAAMGMDRLLQLQLGLPNIQETLLFPWGNL